MLQGSFFEGAVNGFPNSVQVNTEVHLYTFPDMRDALRIGLLLFEPCLEAQQALIPFRTDVRDPLLKFCERLRRQGIALLATRLMDSNQSRVFEDCEMLEYSLPRNRVFLGQLGGRPGAMFCQIDQQTPAYGISQRGEK